MKITIGRKAARYLVATLLTIVAFPIAASSKNDIPDHVANDQTKALELTHSLAYPKGFELNLGARLTRTISHVEEDDRYRAHGRACLYRGDVENWVPMVDVMAKYAKLCNSPLKIDLGLGTQVTGRTRLDYSSLLEGRMPTGWKSLPVTLYCLRGDDVVFAAEWAYQSNGMFGKSCPGHYAFNVSVAKSASDAMNKEHHGHIERHKDEDRKVSARQAAEIAIENERLAHRRKEMANVQRGDRVCSDEFIRGSRYSAYVEEVSGFRMKVLIIGTADGNVFRSHPKPQELHWTDTGLWSACQ